MAGLAVAALLAFLLVCGSAEGLPTGKIDHRPGRRRLQASLNVTVSTLKTDAVLGAPYGLALDDADNLYVANSDKDQVLRILAGSGKTELLGTSAVPAFSNPYDVAVSSSRDVYMTDPGNRLVRLISAKTGEVTNLGTSANPAFIFPTGISLDKALNIFIADVYSGLVRRIDASTHVVTTLGTSAFPKFFNPTGVTVGPDLSVFVCDTGNNLVRKINLTTGVVTNLGTSANPPIYAPDNLALDGNNTMFFADFARGLVRRIDSVTGAVTTVSAGANPKISGPWGVVVNSVGNVVTSDARANKIRVIEIGTAPITRLAATAAPTLAPVSAVTARPTPTPTDAPTAKLFLYGDDFACGAFVSAGPPVGQFGSTGSRHIRNDTNSRQTFFCDFHVCGEGKISITTNHAQADGQATCGGMTELRVFDVTTVPTLSKVNEVAFERQEYSPTTNAVGHLCARTSFNVTTTPGVCKMFTIEQGCYIGGCNATTYVTGTKNAGDRQSYPTPVLSPVVAPAVTSAPTVVSVGTSTGAPSSASTSDLSVASPAPTITSLLGADLIVGDTVAGSAVISLMHPRAFVAQIPVGSVIIGRTLAANAVVTAVDPTSFTVTMSIPAINTATTVPLTIENSIRGDTVKDSMSVTAVESIQGISIGSSVSGADIAPETVVTALDAASKTLTISKAALTTTANSLLTVRTSLVVITPTPPSAVPSAVPTVAATEAVSTPRPTPTPSLLPTFEPRAHPSPVPSERPTPSPSSGPTPHPSERPTLEPSAVPSPAPTAAPSQPTPEPSMTPTYTAEAPTPSPSAGPTPAPSFEPSHPPSPAPSHEPTPHPSELPSPAPSAYPTVEPSAHPSAVPTQRPTFTHEPSARPTSTPTYLPDHPTPRPTSMPTAPSPAPTYNAHCVLFQSTRTNSDADGWTPICGFRAEEGSQVLVTTCPQWGGFCKGPAALKVFYLVDKKKTFLNESGLTHTEHEHELCGGCPEMSVVVPGRAVTGATADLTFYVQEGCYGNATCEGSVSIVNVVTDTLVYPPPTALPSLAPSTHPSPAPSREPSHAPTAHPSVMPTARPSPHPSPAPTFQPSTKTKSPIARPSPEPSLEPSKAPRMPTHPPSARPSPRPTRRPVPPTLNPTWKRDTDYGYPYISFHASFVVAGIDAVTWNGDGKAVFDQFFAQSLANVVEMTLLNESFRANHSMVAFLDNNPNQTVLDFLGPLTASLGDGDMYPLFLSEDGSIDEGDQQYVSNEIMIGDSKVVEVQPSNVDILFVNNINCDAAKALHGGRDDLCLYRDSPPPPAAAPLDRRLAGASSDPNTGADQGNSTLLASNTIYPGTKFVNVTATITFCPYMLGFPTSIDAIRAVGFILFSAVNMPLGGDPLEVDDRGFLKDYRHNALTEELADRIGYYRSLHAVQVHRQLSGPSGQAATSGRGRRVQRARRGKSAESQRSRSLDSVLDPLSADDLTLLESFVSHDLAVYSVLFQTGNIPGPEDGFTFAPISQPTPFPVPAPSPSPTPLAPKKPTSVDTNAITSTMSGLSSTSKAGIAVGVLLLIGCVIGVGCYYRQKGQKDEDDHGHGGHDVELANNTMQNARSSFAPADGQHGFPYDEHQRLSHDQQQEQQQQHGLHQDGHEGDTEAEAEREREMERERERESQMEQEQVLHEYELRESQWQEEQRFQEDQRRYLQELAAYEEAKAAFEAQQRELAESKNTFNPMMVQAQAQGRRGSYLQQLRQAQAKKEVEDSTLLEEVAAEILRRKDAVETQERELAQRKAAFDAERVRFAQSQAQSQAQAKPSSAELEEVARYQHDLLAAAQQQQEQQQTLHEKEQELYNQQLAQEQYARELQEYKAQLEAYQRLQEEAAVQLEEEAAEHERRLTINLGHLEAQDPSLIHEGYQQQLQVMQQQMDALMVDKQQLQGSSQMQLAQAREEHRREREEYLRQISEQQELLMRQRGQVLELEEQQFKLAEYSASLERLQEKSQAAHVNASISLGTTAEALKAMEDLKRTQDAELHRVLREREDLSHKHERLKAEHKASVDKSRAHAQVMRRDRDHLPDLSSDDRHHHHHHHHNHHPHHQHHVHGHKAGSPSAAHRAFGKPPVPPKKPAGLHVHGERERVTDEEFQVEEPRPHRRLEARPSAFQLHEMALKRSSHTMPVSNRTAPSMAFQAVHTATHNNPGLNPLHAPPSSPTLASGVGGGGGPPPLPPTLMAHPHHGTGPAPRASMSLSWKPTAVAVDMLVQSGAVNSAGASPIINHHQKRSSIGAFFARAGQQPAPPTRLNPINSQPKN